MTVLGQSFQCFHTIYMVDDILGLPLRMPASTIFSSQSYVSESPSGNLGRPYSWDQMFGYQGDHLPWNVDLPLSDDEVESVEVVTAAEEPASTVSIVGPISVAPPTPSTELIVRETSADHPSTVDPQSQVPSEVQAYVTNQMDHLFKRVEDLLKSLFQQGPPPPPPS